MNCSNRKIPRKDMAFSTFVLNYNQASFKNNYNNYKGENRSRAIFLHAIARYNI